VRHSRERPALQVLALDRWVEQDAAAVPVEAHAELDVLDRREWVTALVEAAESEEGFAPDGAETGPERRRGTGALVVDVMVEEVAEVGDDPTPAGVVVVRSEDGGELGVVLERLADSREDVVVHLDVGVDEDDDVRRRLPCAEIPRGGRTEMSRLVDDDHLLGSRRGAVDRRHDALERRAPVGRRDDDAQGDHVRSLGAC
jgi:hypothetical protein